MEENIFRIVLIITITLLTYGVELHTEPLRIKFRTWREGLAITGGVALCVLAEIY